MVLYSQRDGKGPVFIHSGFRAASTWLWNHFRANPEFFAYYEIFNENLAVLTAAEIDLKTSASWRSGHPKSSPYFLEFLPLLDAEGGVRDFIREDEFGAHFIPIGGLTGELYQDDLTYVRGMITAATATQRVPVLTCTRTLGRVCALKRQVGGTHVVLKRNLYHQWSSFSGQHRTGNPYFIASTLFYIFNNSEDQFFRFLGSLLPDLGKVEILSVIENNYDDVFAIFVAWHIYLIIHAERYADITIDVNRLGDPADTHRAVVEEALEHATGQRLSLADARSAIDLPWRPIANPEAARIKVEMLVERACVELNATIFERLSVASMLDDTWREYDRFTLYSKSALETIIDSVNECEELKASVVRADVDRRDLSEKYTAQLTTLQGSLEVSNQHLELERDRTAEALGYHAAQLAELQGALDRSKEELDLEREAAAEAISSYVEQIARLQSELDVNSQDFIQERSALEQDLRAYTEKISGLQIDLADRCQDLEQEQINLTEMRRAHAEKTDEQQGELDNVNEDLAQEISRLEQALWAHARQTAGLQRELEDRSRALDLERNELAEAVQSHIVQLADLNGVLDDCKQQLNLERRSAIDVGRAHAERLAELEGALEATTRHLDLERESAIRAQRVAEDDFVLLKKASSDQIASLEAAWTQHAAAEAAGAARRGAEIDRLTLAHATEISRLRADLAATRAWAAASNRSLQVLSRDREHAAQQLKELLERGEMERRQASEEAARTASLFADERNAADAHIHHLTTELAASQRRNEEQSAAFEDFLRVRTIERASRADMKAQFDAALRDQAAVFEHRVGEVVKQRDAALDVLKDLKRERRSLYKEFAMEGGPVALRWSLPLARVISWSFKKRRNLSTAIRATLGKPRDRST